MLTVPKSHVCCKKAATARELSLPSCQGSWNRPMQQGIGGVHPGGGGGGEKHCSAPLMVTLPVALVGFCAPTTLLCSVPLRLSLPLAFVPAKVSPGSSTSINRPSASV